MKIFSRKAIIHNLPEILDALKIHYDRIGRREDKQFTSIKPFGEAEAESLVFLDKPDLAKLEQFVKSPVKLILLRKTWARDNVSALNRIKKSIYLVDNPRQAVAKILDHISTEEDMVSVGIHPTAIVHPEAEIDETAGIGPYCVIGRCRVGPHSRIFAHTVIHTGVNIGSRVIIREFCVIGGHGYGIVRDENTGKLQRMPHIGGVIIEDDVELHTYVHVDQGTLSNTVIGHGTKIAHKVLIGHNVHIGCDCIITAGAVFCGKSSTGNRAWVGVGSIFKEGTKLGDDTVTGLGAVILKDVPAGMVVVGVPAKPIPRKDK